MEANVTREQSTSVFIGWIWGLIALTTVVFVLLGSWYPFELMPGQFDAAWQQWLDSTSTTPSKSDFAINLVLGIPLGFFGLLALLRASNRYFTGTLGGLWKRSFSATLVLCLVVACGLVAELGQHWFGHRVPSAYDTFAQGIGGTIGIACACLGGVWFTHRMDELIGGYGAAPFWALLDLYFVSYAAWMLMPFIPSVSPSELKEKWKSGMIQLSVIAEWRSDVWQALYTAVITSLCAVPIGLGVARHLRSYSTLAFVCAAAVVIGLEVLQVVIETRSAQASDALWATVGAMIGVLSYSYWSKTDTAQHEANNGRYSLIWNFAAVLGMFVYLGIALAPFEWIDTKAELVERVRQLRSQIGNGMLAGNDMMNASNLLRSLFMSLVLGAIFGCATILSRDARNWIGMVAVGVMLTSICAGTELLQIFSAQHTPSLLAAVVRIIGGWLGFAISVNIVRRSTEAFDIE